MTIFPFSEAIENNSAFCEIDWVISRAMIAALRRNIHMKLELIQQLSELDGGEFLEVFPGPFKGRSWNEESVYIDDKAFALIEPILKRYAPNFDHRSNTAISKDAWLSIISELRALSRDLAIAATPEDLEFSLGTRYGSVGEFNLQFRKNADSLRALIDAWLPWLERSLETQTVISILGI